MSDTIIQIVPHRGVAPEGVGDYARIIAERLLADYGLRTIFVTGTPLPPADRLYDEWETHVLPVRRTSALLETLSRLGSPTAPPILMHLSGYGYQKKGAPFWVSRALTRWRLEHPATPLATLFHEIYATGPITGSAFWMSPFQKAVARHILAVSTAAITTTEPYAACLRSWAQGMPEVLIVPVFSTIGETPDVKRASQRAATMVVFGRPGIYDAVYVAGRERLEAFVSRQGISHIIDIGERTKPPPATLGNAKVEVCGRLPATTLRNRIADARFGLMDYNADLLAKSTIFAAYCAQGAIPVCLSDRPGYYDGLTPRGNYIKLVAGQPNELIDPAALDALQEAALRWYRPHALGSTIDTIYGLLQPQRSAEG